MYIGQSKENGRMDGGITMRRPVTLTRRLATVGDDGCASRVVILCWTLLKGRL